MDGIVKLLRDQLEDYKKLRGMYQEQKELYRKGEYDKISGMDKKYKVINDAILERNKKLGTSAADVCSGKLKVDEPVEKEIKSLVNEIQITLKEAVQYVDSVREELVKETGGVKKDIKTLRQGQKGIKGYKGFKENIPKMIQEET